MKIQHIPHLPACAMWLRAFGAVALWSALTSVGLVAQTIPNPSFEANTFTGGQGTVNANAAITGWSTNDASRVGLNPVNGANPFADNGKVPQGTRVAFVRSEGSLVTLSTTITGLVAGAHYMVTMKLNRRAAATAPFGTCRIGEGPAVTMGEVLAAGPAGTFTAAYHPFTTFFVASGPTAVMEIGNNTAADSTLLVDDFKIEAATPMQVTNANNDGPGSLRAVVAAAWATPAFNLITFAPALSGQMIRLETSISAGGPVAIDGSSLPKGIKLQITTGSSVPRPVFDCLGQWHLRGLSFFGTRGGPAVQSALIPGYFMLITRCSFANAANAVPGVPAAVYNNGSNVVLQQCTFRGNVGYLGGAIQAKGGFTTLEHCTLAGNQSNDKGGGIYMHSGAFVIVSNSILSDNAATSSGYDIYIDNSTLYYPSLNIVRFLAGNGTVLGTPAESILVNFWDWETDGTTGVLSLKPDSLARNRVPAQNIRTDQRGRPVIGLADLGAYEMQPGTFTLDPGGSLQEGNVAHTVTVRRDDGFEGAATVRLSASAGTAGAADFTPFANQTVSFSDGQETATVPVQIKSDSLVEANETFNLSLSSPSAGALLGSPSTTTVTIVDGSALAGGPDNTRPGPVVFTSPAAGASVNADGDGWDITITGTASDNKGVKLVLLRIAEDEEDFPLTFQQARLESPDATATKWSFQYSVASSVAKLRIEAQAFDNNNNGTLGLSTHSFKVLLPLQVAVSGNGVVSPAGYAPMSYREVGQSQTITATPSAGYLFNGWDIAGATLAEVGVNTPNLDRPTLNFYHRYHLMVKAKFSPNPFVNNAFSGNFNGLIGATPAKINTEGVVDVTVTTTGAFSAKLTLDGSVLGFAGAFDGQGKARFGTARALSALVPRPGKPSLRVQLSFDQNPFGLQRGIVASVEMLNFGNSTVESVSGNLRQARGSVDPYWLGPGGANQGYNLAMNLTPLGPTPIPLVCGIGRVTLTKSGMALFTDIALADGTTGLTASALVNIDNRIALHIPLYGGRGFYKAEFDLINSPGAPDLGSFIDLWGKPADYTSHYFPDGWLARAPTTGYKHVVTSGQSVLMRGVGGVLPPPTPAGNVELTFSGGLLTEPIVRRVNISANDAVTKVPSNDPTFTLTIDRATGLIRGTFLHEDGNMIPFQGITHPLWYGRSFGFFLSYKPTPIDYSGTVGAVTLYGF